MFDPRWDDGRELVVDRDRVYELSGEDSRTLAAIGAFRAIPERDLAGNRDDSPDNDTLEHLRDERLLRTVALGEHDQPVVLTDEGYELLESNRRDRDDGEGAGSRSAVLRRPRALSRLSDRVRGRWSRPPRGCRSPHAALSGRPCRRPGPGRISALSRAHRRGRPIDPAPAFG